MEQQAEKISKQLELELKYTENEKLIHRTEKYIDMFKYKWYLEENKIDAEQYQEKLK